MSNQIEIMKEVIKESGLNVPELHIDEWNFTVSNRNVINDSCEQAAYIIKTVWMSPTGLILWHTGTHWILILITMTRIVF